MKEPKDKVQSPLDDEQLLRGCQRGDEDALAEIIRRYQRPLYRLARRVAGDATLAEEATVETFYKVWRKARQWNGQTSPDAWIYRIAVRTVLDLQRGRRRWWNRLRSVARDSDHDPRPGPDEEAGERERQRLVASELNRAIQTLKEEDRALVYMYYFEGRGLPEIAPMLATSREVLKMRLARARQRLQKILGDFDDNSAI